MLVQSASMFLFSRAVVPKLVRRLLYWARQYIDDAMGPIFPVSQKQL